LIRSLEPRFPTPQDPEYLEALAERGYDTRFDYIAGLAADNDLDLEAVCEIADLLGENEDFDGLVTFLEDHAGHEAFSS